MFESSQRTQLSEPRLPRDKHDDQQMDDAKSKIAHPTDPCNSTGNDGDLAENDERHHADMGPEYSVCEKPELRWCSIYLQLSPLSAGRMCLAIV